MDKEVIKDLATLKDCVIQWQKRTTRALGFTQTLEYKQLFFYVGQRYVVADLSPLAYVDLVEEIGGGDIQTAVTCLYERLSPLLECAHHWRGLSASTRSQILSLDSALESGGSRVRSCTECSAYGLESAEVALPAFGRGSGWVRD